MSSFVGMPVSVAVVTKVPAHVWRMIIASDDTDETNMGWLPRKLPSQEQREPAARGQSEEGRCVVVCAVSKRQVGVVLGNVAEYYRTGRMEELVVCYSGVRHELPDLSLFDSDGLDSDAPVGPLRVTIENGDFHGLDDGPNGPRFRSPAVTALKFAGCDLVLLPRVSGFPNLKGLEVDKCYFNHYYVLSLLPSAEIEYLRVARCGGELDGSPIAGLTKLKTLVMTDCTGREYPDFDEAARVSLHGRLVGGELNGNGRGLLCKEIARRLQVECCAGLAICEADCDCGGGCSDGE
jgi:hypothetical protein